MVSSVNTLPAQDKSISSIFEREIRECVVFENGKLTPKSMREIIHIIKQHKITHIDCDYCICDNIDVNMCEDVAHTVVKIAFVIDRDSNEYFMHETPMQIYLHDDMRKLFQVDYCVIVDSHGNRYLYVHSTHDSYKNW